MSHAIKITEFQAASLVIVQGFQAAVDFLAILPVSDYLLLAGTLIDLMVKRFHFHPGFPVQFSQMVQCLISGNGVHPGHGSGLTAVIAG